MFFTRMTIFNRCVNDASRRTKRAMIHRPKGFENNASPVFLFFFRFIPMAMVFGSNQNKRRFVEIRKLNFFHESTFRVILCDADDQIIILTQHCTAKYVQSLVY